MYGSSDTGAALRKEQEKREGDVRGAQSAIEMQFSGFGPDFYKAREKAYLGFALPQLAEQYQEAQKDLTYSLAAKGLLRSGAAGTLATSLQKELHKKKQGVADAAIGQSQELRGQVEEEQSRLLSQAMQALDPGATVVSARKAATQFTEPSNFVPVGRMFSDWTSSYVAKKTSDAYRESESDALNFGTGRDASRTVNS